MDPRLTSDWALYRRMLRQAKPYWPHITAYFLLTLLATPLGLVAPVPLKIAVDSAIGSRPLPHAVAMFVPAAATQSRPGILLLAVVMLVCVALLSQAQVLLSALLYSYTGEKLLLDFRTKLFHHMQRLSLNYHDMEGAADSVYRIRTDAAALQYVSIDGVIPFVTSAVKLVAMLYVILRIDGRLAMVAMAISPPLYILSRSYRPRLRASSRTVRKLESSAQSVVQEVLSALRLVKAFGRESHERDRFTRTSAEGMRARIHLAMVSGYYDTFVGLTTAAGTAAILWIGVRHVQGGTLTIGSLLLLMAYIGQLYDPLKTIGKKSASLQGNLASAERAFAILDRPSDVEERSNARLLKRSQGVVAFQNVSFSYDGEHPVLHDISFEVPAGSRIGIAGRTGAGKTTLVSLLTRFYDPSSGRILLDGVDLRDYRLADLRDQFAIVLQEPILFSTTVAENIGYARPSADNEAIVRAAKLANAHDFIVALPQGYDTLVGERGVRLSGGERQRISLARAFLKDAPILLLDEPTSSVDIGTEAAIMEAIERLMFDRTTFIIAHRLTTLRNCDIRLELENGRIRSLSTHALATAGP